MTTTQRVTGYTADHDERTPEERHTHPQLIIGTDRFLSGWGKAARGKSIAAWAVRLEDADKVLAWVEARKDMSNVRVGYARTWRPRAAHVTIYVVRPGHPALD